MQGIFKKIGGGVFFKSFFVLIKSGMSETISGCKLHKNLHKNAGCQAFLFSLFFSLNSFFPYFLLFFSLNSYFPIFFQILRLRLSLGMGM